MRRLRLRRRQGRRHAAGHLRRIPGLSRPRPVLHGRRLDRDVRHLHPAPDLCPRQRRSRKQGHPRPCREHAEDQQRRQDLHAETAQGPQILRRHPGQGLGLHVRGRTDVPAQLGRLALLHDDRRRRKIPGNQEGRDTGDQDERRDRGDRHQPDRAAGNLQQRARPDVRRPTSSRHSDQEPVWGPAAGDGPLRDRQLRSRPWLVLRAQPAVGEDELEADAGPAQRPRRQDRHQDRPQHRDPGERRRTKQHRVDAGPDPARRLRRGGQQVRGYPAARGVRNPQHLLLLDEHTEAAVRRPQGAPGGQPRGQRRSPGTDIRRLAEPLSSRFSQKECLATRSTNFTPTTWPKRRS